MKVLGLVPPRITRAQAIEVIAWCTSMQVGYGSMSSYASVRSIARKRNIRCPTNNMLLHYPRVRITGAWAVQENPKAYIIWRGEPLEQVIETCAYVRMTTNKRFLMVLRDGKGE